jgi:adenosylcobinamide-GDP ribazoletransferase
MPRFEWKDDDMAHSLTFFPVVGAVIGAVICLLNCISPISSLPVAVRIIVTILIPLVITGGFHVDGFMDTEDAMNSYASKEKKLEILKDSHIGAFAVISLVKWLLAYAAAITALLLSDRFSFKVCVIFGMTFVISRGLSGLTSLLFEKAKKTGMLYEETKNKQRGTVICLTVQLILACAAVLYMNIFYGAVVLVAFALYTLYYRYKVYKEFGGVTGDTAGFFLTTGEVVSAVMLGVATYLF